MLFFNFCKLRAHFVDSTPYALSSFDIFFPGASVYLVCKSHPRATAKEAESQWRMSFSMLEIAYARSVPKEFHLRKQAFLSCKEYITIAFDHYKEMKKKEKFEEEKDSCREMEKKPQKCPVQSYEMKTVFFRLLEEGKLTDDMTLF